MHAHHVGAAPDDVNVPHQAFGGENQPEIVGDGAGIGTQQPGTGFRQVADDAVDDRHVVGQKNFGLLQHPLAACHPFVDFRSLLPRHRHAFPTLRGRG